MVMAGCGLLILFHKKLLLSQGKMPDDLSIREMGQKTAETIEDAIDTIKSDAEK